MLCSMIGKLRSKAPTLPDGLKTRNRGAAWNEQLYDIAIANIRVLLLNSACDFILRFLIY